jgi:cytokinin dehydrogenase
MTMNKETEQDKHGTEVPTNEVASNRLQGDETFPCQVDRSSKAVAKASRDFGRMIPGHAKGVIAVTTPDELVMTVRNAKSSGVSLTPCGTRSSCGGQSLPNGGLSLDMTSMNAVGPVDLRNATIECESGATLRSISEATLPFNLLPNILSFNLDITIGGVLSAGGFGANCHRFGPMVANVVSLDVVTGEGHLVHCSRTEETALFEAVLGGLGHCGVIARATLALRQIKPKVRIWSLLYHSHQDWLDAQESLTRSNRCDYMQGFFWAGPKLLRSTPTGFHPEATWFYGLSIGCEYEGEAPDDEMLLADLKPSSVLAVDDADTAQFIDLYRDRFIQMRRTNAWQRPHPWIDCLLAPDVVREVLPKILKKLPMAAGDGHRLAWFPTKNLPGLFSVPSGELAVAFAVLPMSIEESVYEETLAALDQVRRMLWDLGGKAYLVGWFGPMDDAAWRRHYGDRYDAWIAAKEKYDPHRVLHSMAFND